jgi:hypothetical protein
VRVRDLRLGGDQLRLPSSTNSALRKEKEVFLRIIPNTIKMGKRIAFQN